MRSIGEMGVHPNRSSTHPGSPQVSESQQCERASNAGGLLALQMAAVITSDRLSPGGARATGSSPLAGSLQPLARSLVGPSIHY